MIAKPPLNEILMNILFESIYVISKNKEDIKHITLLKNQSKALYYIFQSTFMV